MDSIDLKILELLKENGKATASEISRKVNLSIPAVGERIRKLDEGGIIEGYTVKLNREKLGYELLAVVFVNVETQQIPAFRQAAVAFEEVIACHHMAGEYDYLLKILVRNTRELEEFLSGRLKALSGIQKTNTLIVLSTLKEKENR